MKKWLISYSSTRKLSESELSTIASKFGGSVEFIGQSEGKPKWNYNLYGDIEKERLTKEHLCFLRDNGLVPFLYNSDYDQIIKELFEGYK